MGAIELLPYGTVNHSYISVICSQSGVSDPEISIAWDLARNANAQAPSQT